MYLLKIGARLRTFSRSVSSVCDSISRKFRLRCFRRQIRIETVLIGVISLILIANQLLKEKKLVLTQTAKEPQAKTISDKSNDRCAEYYSDVKRNHSVKLNIYNMAKTGTISLALATHMTTGKLEMLEKIADRWKGVMSVSVYANETNFSTFTEKYLRSPSLGSRKNIYIHYVEINGNQYPGNTLRNAAVDFCEMCKYLFLNDVDFIPSSNIEDDLNSFIKEDYISRKKVLVVPAFETLRKGTVVPENKSQLMSMWDREMVSPFHIRSFKEGHQPTNFSYWKSAKTSYQIKYKEHFEPYILAERAYLPRYHEIFVNRFFDKSSHALELHHSGFEFHVAPNVFVVHIFHPIDRNAISVHRCAKRIYNDLKKRLQLMYQNVTAY